MKQGSFPKKHFPVMLAELWHKMKLKNVAKNCPLNKTEPLKHLPGGADLVRDETRRKLDHILVDLLKKNRGEGDNLEKKKR